MLDIDKNAFINIFYYSTIPQCPKTTVEASITYRYIYVLNTVYAPIHPIPSRSSLLPFRFCEHILQALLHVKDDNQCNDVRERSANWDRGPFSCSSFLCYRFICKQKSFSTAVQVDRNSRINVGSKTRAFLNYTTQCLDGSSFSVFVPLTQTGNSFDIFLCFTNIFIVFLNFFIVISLVDVIKILFYVYFVCCFILLAM